MTPRPSRIITCLLVILIGGCSKQSSNATVTLKDYIPAHIEGTEYQEHQTDREQWIIEIEMVGGRKTRAPVDAEQWKNLKVGDTVRVRYSEGKYTGTIWAIDLEKR